MDPRIEGLIVPAAEPTLHWAPDAEVVDVVRRKAYQIWQDRVEHHRPGDATSDWLAAEAELAAVGEHVTPDPEAPDWS